MAERSKTLALAQSFFDERTKRYAPLSQSAIETLVGAEAEARRLNHNYISTEHLLLGLFRQRDPEITAITNLLGLDPSKVTSAVEFITSRGSEEDESPQEEMKPRTHAIVAIKYANQETERLNEGEIKPKHILIGILREGEGIGFGVLESLGVTLLRVREAAEYDILALPTTIRTKLEILATASSTTGITKIRVEEIIKLFDRLHPQPPKAAPPGEQS